MHSFMLRVAAAAMVAGSGPAHAVAQPDGPPQVWQLDWENSHCIVSTGDPSNLLLSLWMTPGDPSPDLYVAGPSAKLRTAAAKGTVVLGPGNESFTTGLIQRFGKSGGWVLEYFELKDGFPTAFARSTEVQLTSLNVPVTVQFKGEEKAMAALKDCVDNKLIAWGIDAKAYESLRSPPIDPGHMDWFTAYDYPDDAMQAGFEGNVVARVDVDATGKVKACNVVVGSGMDSIDKVTCAKTMKNGKFLPAIGADGNPTAATRTIFVKFQLEG